MLLSDLLESVPTIPKPTQAMPSVEVTAVHFDSRQVSPGSLFVAVQGGNYDGHAYIPDAIEKGACAVIGSQTLDLREVPYLRVENPRDVLARAAAAFYGFPAQQLTVIGVTGTDGKTTTVNLIYQIMLAAGLKAGMISTVNAVIGEEVIDTGFHVTTPEAPTIQALLRKMVDNGMTHVVLETTSHGLDQQRVAACDFDLGVITNITHEHLDYHGNYEGYLQAKARLLTSLTETPRKDQGNFRMAVLNRDDISYACLEQILADEKYHSIHIVTYGMQTEADLTGQNLQTDSNGIRLEAILHGKTFPLQSAMLGDYNASNLLAAAATCRLGLGLDMQLVQQGIQDMPGVPGRMERINLGQDFLAIVDFAHTPNALKVALETVQRMKNGGKVIAVFGSAGLRDRQKRRMMAATALHLADMTILTAEDPRTEQLNDILAEMADEAEKNGGVEGSNFLRVPDRGEAIREAVRLANRGDIVMACGKGHEQSMCFGETEYTWDDRTAIRAALSQRLGLPGPKMPYLPTQK